jgi:NADP-dependent 3-hydroxy acid dehydrogenase YdfG
MGGELSNTVIAVTGASSGIGEATALACARAGAAVSLAARRSERIEELAERIQGEGGRALAIATDVGEEEQARARAGAGPRLHRAHAGVTPLESEDIAAAILYAISQPANVSINEVLVRPSGQVR